LFLVHEIFVNAAYFFETTNPRPRIVDCGANIGMAVLFFKAVRPEAEVIAFEPDPTAFARLVQTVTANKLSGVQLENAAVGNRDGMTAFYLNRSDAGGLTASTSPAWGGTTRQEVRSVRLSALLREPIDFLKMDVEGAEYDVVHDLIDTGAIRWVRETVIEYHELAAKPNAMPVMREALRSSGFDVRVTPMQHQTGIIRARRRERIGA
jgi:FkbM family methyltransferase